MSLPTGCALVAGDSLLAYAEAHRGSDGFTFVASPDGSPARFRWSSRSPAVASISAGGLLHAHRAGAAWIAVTTDGVRDSARVTVAPSSEVRVTLDPPPPYVLPLGDTLRVRFAVEDTRGAAARQQALRMCPPRLERRGGGQVWAEQSAADSTQWLVHADERWSGLLQWHAAGRHGLAQITVRE